MKKKREIKDNSMPKDLPSMFGTSITRGYLKNNPESETIIQYVCDQLIEYACGDKGFYVGSFLREMRIPKQTFYNWVAKYPQLAEALEEAKYYMGHGRMDGALTRRLDRGAVFHSQYRFGEEWKQDDAYQAQLKKVDEQQPTNITIHMPEIEKVIDREKFKPVDGKEISDSDE